MNPYAIQQFGNPQPPAGRGGRGGAPLAPAGAGRGRGNQVPPQQPNPNGRIRNGRGQLLRARTWVVTYRTHAPPPNMTSAYTNRYVSNNNYSLDYQVGQMEFGAQQGGLHWQGYFEFSGPVTAFDILDYLQWPAGQVHLEPRWGSQTDAVNYCTKEDTRAPDYEPEEFGVAHPPDAVDAIAQAHQAIQNGAQMRNFLHNNNLARVALRYPNGIQTLIRAREQEDAKNQPDTRPLKVILYYGDTRSGKSGSVYRWAKEHGLAIYKKARAAALGFTDYDKHPILLLEEFDHTSVPIHDAQEWLDQRPMLLNAKYSQTYAAWNYVFICTNVAPDLWYPNANPEVRASIQARIHEIWHFTKNEITLEKGEGEFPPTPDPDARPPPNIIYRRNALQQITPAPAPAAGIQNETIDEFLRKQGMTMADLARRLEAMRLY